MMESKRAQSYVEMLRKILEERKATKRRYSLRAFSRDIEMSPSNVSNILSGRRGLSGDQARAICKKLELSQEDTKWFVLSAEATSSRSPKKRQAAAQEILTFSNRRRSLKQISEKEFDILGSWHHLAILELFELERSVHTPAWFAQELGISVEATQNILDKLLDLKMIEYRDGKFAATFGESRTAFGKPSATIRAYHRSILQTAEEKLERTSINERDYSSMLFAFDKEKMQEAKEVLRDFQMSFAERFYAPKPSANTVYQVSLQFFRVDGNNEVKK